MVAKLKSGLWINLSVCVAPLVFFAIYFLINQWHFTNPCSPHGDYALISFETEKAKSLEAFAGPYSRFGFRHPLPTYFYYYAAVEPLVWFAQSPEAAYNFAHLLLNFAFVLTAVLIIAQSSDSQADSYLFFLCLVYTLYAARTGVLSDLWGPCTLVVPLIAFLVLSAKVSTGGLTDLPLLVLSAVFTLANHVSGAVIVAMLGVLSAALAIVDSKKLSWQRRSTVSLCSVLLILLIAFSPAIYELVRYGHDSAPVKLLRFLVKGSGQNHPSLSQSVGFIAGLIIAPIKSVSGNSLAWSIPVLILPWCIGYRTDPFFGRLRLLTFSALVIAVFLVSRIQGELYRYLAMYVFGPIALTYFLGLKVILEQVYRRFATAKWLTTWGLPLIFALLSVIGVRKYYLKERRCLTSLESMTQDLIPQLGGQSSRLVIHDLDLWGAAAGINLKLLRAGYRNCVPKDWGFMFGRDFVCGVLNAGVIPNQSIHFYNKNQLKNIPTNAAVGERTVAVVNH